MYSAQPPEEREMKELQEGSQNPSVDGKRNNHIILNKSLNGLEAFGKGGVAKGGAAVCETLGGLAPNEEVVVPAEGEEDGGEFGECGVGDHSIG